MLNIKVQTSTTPMLQTVGLEEVGRERARHRAVEPEHYRVEGLLAPELRALLADEHGPDHLPPRDQLGQVPLRHEDREEGEARV